MSTENEEARKLAIRKELDEIEEAARNSKPINPIKGPEGREFHLNRAREARRKRLGNKVQITMRFDPHVVDYFREQNPDGGYQSMINKALCEWIETQKEKEIDDRIADLESRLLKLESAAASNNAEGVAEQEAAAA